ncbi:hypothetical protein MPH_03258 [Macrophomina phaseolina MS6]|uniref:Uncharacterized protein n=1 Tax=Macrophomina phaseolina (strain MS6) TaxID=1126212 RepID=K2SRT0_MACPH|nr:hypothetical protein MPH_03258 [Macrophomina phaseolina MS6]
MTSSRRLSRALQASLSGRRKPAALSPYTPSPLPFRRGFADRQLTFINRPIASRGQWEYPDIEHRPRTRKNEETPIGNTNDKHWEATKHANLAAHFISQRRHRGAAKYANGDDGGAGEDGNGVQYPASELDRGVKSAWKADDLTESALSSRKRQSTLPSDVPDHLLLCDNSVPGSLGRTRSELVSLIEETPWNIFSPTRCLYRTYTFVDNKHVLQFLVGIRGLLGPKGPSPGWAVAGNRVYLRWMASPKEATGFSADMVGKARQSDKVLAGLGEKVLVPNSDDNFRYSERWARQKRLIYPVVRKFPTRKKAWDHCCELLKNVKNVNRKWRFALVSTMGNFVYESQTRFATSRHYGVRVLVPPAKMDRYRLLKLTQVSIKDFSGRNPVPGLLEVMAQQVSTDWKGHCPGYSPEKWAERIHRLEEQGQLRHFEKTPLQ